MRLSSRAVAWVLGVEMVAMLLTAGLIADVRAHAAVEQRDGLNMRGFRGPLRLKAVGGARIAVLGGSAAYGLRVEWIESFPHYLEGALNQAWRTKYPHSYTEVINLAAPGDGAATYITTLRDYAYLKPDVVCILDGFAGLGATGAAGARHESRMFARTGYMPILHDVIARRAPWAASDRAVVDPLLRDGAAGDPSCDGGSREYCDAIVSAVAWAADRGMAVAVVTPPYISARHEAQQRSLAARLAQRFAGNRSVRYFDMGRQVDVTDRRQSFDGAHLTAAGNQALAESLVDAMFDVLPSR
jgi:hypothetical protein